VPPFTGVPVVDVDDELGPAPPQALSMSTSSTTREKDIVRKRGLGFVRIISSNI
jgi:hypothetical protein